MSPEVLLGAEFDRDIQNWAKDLGTVKTGVPTKNKIHAPGVSTHARFTRRLGLFSSAVCFAMQIFAKFGYFVARGHQYSHRPSWSPGN